MLPQAVNCPLKRVNSNVYVVNEHLLAAVNASGQAFLSPTRLDDRLVLRLVVSGLRVREDDVRAAWLLCQKCLNDLLDAVSKPDRSAVER